MLEYFWTFFPVVLVLILFVPLFFYFDNFSDISTLYFFIVGNQWFWDFFFLDSFGLGLPYDFNFYDCVSINLPILLNLKIYLTSNDVLHAFSLPILYTMIDLVPGNIHSLYLLLPYIGIYTVYCIFSPAKLFDCTKCVAGFSERSTIDFQSTIVISTPLGTRRRPETAKCRGFLEIPMEPPGTGNCQ